MRIVRAVVFVAGVLATHPANAIVKLAEPVVIDLPPIVVSVDSVRVAEGDSGQRAASFTVRLSRAPGPFAASVDFETRNLSAHAGIDFEAALGTLSFGPDQDELHIDVAVFGDSVVEGNERFMLLLTNPAPGFELGDSVGLGTIVNDERPRFRVDRAGLTPYYIGNLPPAFGYADDDALPDLPINRNLGSGLFEPHDGMAQALIWGNHHGSAWCDYDRDGRSDLVISPYAQGDTASKLQLLRNFGQGVFTDVAPLLGMDVVGHGETPVWGDFDGDLWPDLFVPYYSDFPPWRSYLWRNNQDGTFSDVTVAAGVGMPGLPPDSRPEGADGSDWSGDGALDLYCAHRLFLNDGFGHFVDVRQAAGLPATFDEGSKFVDVNGDGELDLYLRTPLGPKLYRNEKGSFSDMTEEAGLLYRPFFWGDSWADVDNDGDMDLLFMNPEFAEMFFNQGDGTFVPETLGVSTSLSAWADVDLDGDLDAAIGASERLMLFNDLAERPGARDAHFAVWVLDADGRRTCPGAIVRLHEIGGGPGNVQTRVVDGGSGYLTQGEYPVHFGGIGSSRYWLEVRYPGTPHTMTVVDGRTHALLEDFNPVESGIAQMFVFRNGHVEWQSSLAAGAERAPLPERRPEALGRPWPSPARDAVSVSARVAIGPADLDVHDLSGRRIRTLARAIESPGTHPFEWDLRDDAGRPVPSGIYFLRLRARGRLEGERRVVVLR